MLADVALQGEDADDGPGRIAGHERPGYGGRSATPTDEVGGVWPRTAPEPTMGPSPRTRAAPPVAGWSSSSTALATLPPASLAVAGSAGGRGPQITVMTRNLYLGSGLANLTGVSGPAELTTGWSGEDWANVLATDFRTRAAALAEEVARARPDVLGLQEVTLWRDSPVSDLREHPGPDATHVVLDHLAVLTSALAARGRRTRRWSSRRPTTSRSPGAPPAA